MAPLTNTSLMGMKRIPSQIASLKQIFQTHERLLDLRKQWNNVQVNAFSSWNDAFPTWVDAFHSWNDTFPTWVDSFPTWVDTFPSWNDAFPTWVDTVPTWAYAFASWNEAFPT
jgi:hypothetical protein